jgi:parallel beta-helix repeat protein
LEDHAGNIVIAADNVTLDCAGHSVTGGGTGTGILLDGRSRVTVKNCQVTAFEDGIRIEATAGRSSRNTLAANTVSNNATNGVLVMDSSGDLLTRNIARDNDYWGYHLVRSTNEPALAQRGDE